MGSRYWLWFLISMTATLAAIAGAGYAAARLLAPKPLEKFANSFFEFELQPGWQCAREGMETICSVGPKPHSAIAILALKYRGKEDSLEAYQKHLDKPITIETSDRKTMVSELRELRRRWISDHEWVESVHYQSEVPNYVTHYLATVTSHLGMLVTFSAHKDRYEQYKREFYPMVESLIVYQSRPVLRR